MITRYHKSKGDWRLERWLKFVQSSCVRTKNRESMSATRLDFLPRVNPHRWSYYWYDHYYNDHRDYDSDGHTEESENHGVDTEAHHNTVEHQHSGDSQGLGNLEHTIPSQCSRDEPDSDHPYRDSIDKSHFPTAEQDFDEISVEITPFDQLLANNLESIQPLVSVQAPNNDRLYVPETSGQSRADFKSQEFLQDYQPHQAALPSPKSLHCQIVVEPRSSICVKDSRPDCDQEQSISAILEESPHTEDSGYEDYLRYWDSQTPEPQELEAFVPHQPQQRSKHGASRASSTTRSEQYQPLHPQSSQAHRLRSYQGYQPQQYQATHSLQSHKSVPARIDARASLPSQLRLAQCSRRGPGFTHNPFAQDHADVGSSPPPQRRRAYDGTRCAGSPLGNQVSDHPIPLNEF